MIELYAMLVGLAAAVVLQAVSLVCLAVQARRIEVRLNTLVAQVVDAERDANLALKGIDRRDRIVSELGERIDLLATAHQDEAAELRFDIATGLRAAAAMVDDDFSAFQVPDTFEPSAICG